MISAPNSKEGWITFGLLVSFMYSAIITLNTNTGILDSAVLGLFYGGMMAFCVVILVFIWRVGQSFLIGREEDSV